MKNFKFSFEKITAHVNPFKNGLVLVLPAKRSFSCDRKRKDIEKESFLQVAEENLKFDIIAFDG